MSRIIIALLLAISCVTECQESHSRAFNNLFPVLRSRANSQSERLVMRNIFEVNENVVNLIKGVDIAANDSHMDFKFIDYVTTFVIYSVNKILSFTPIVDILEGAQRGLSTSITCMACHSLIDIIFLPIIPMRVLSQVIISVCSTLRIPYLPTQVCTGFVNLFKDHLDYIRQHTNLKQTEVCGILLGVHCSLSAGTCFADPNYQTSDNLCWKLVLNENKTIERKANTESTNKTMRILQITDIHLDPDYVAYSGDGCGQPYCCRADKSNESDWLSGYWGSYKCDLPLRTVENLFESIDWDSYDLVYWTGDVSPHSTWDDTYNLTIGNSRIITDLLKNYSKSLVIVAIGNHMAVPVGTYPPPNIVNQLSVGPLYREVAEEMSHWFDEENTKTFTRGGYYSVKFRPGFRIIILNTNYCARLNIWTLYQSIDPSDQLKWLIEELSAAEEAGDLVHIVGHIPPDSRECTQSWLYNYLRIVERYSPTIAGQFFGHTHFDEFRALHSVTQCNQSIGFQILSPSATPFDMNYKLNPSYRTIITDPIGQILDMETYKLDLLRANAMPHLKPNWVFEYSMAREYSMAMTVQGFEQLLRSIIRDNYYLQSFYSRYIRTELYIANDYCNSKCKSKLVNDINVCNPFDSIPKPITSHG